MGETPGGYSSDPGPERPDGAGTLNWCVLLFILGMLFQQLVAGVWRHLW